VKFILNILGNAFGMFWNIYINITNPLPHIKTGCLNSVIVIHALLLIPFEIIWLVSCNGEPSVSSFSKAAYIYMLLITLRVFRPE